MISFLDNHNKLRILAYHRIINPTDDFIQHRGVISATPENFERQIKFLVKNYNLISFEHLKQAVDAKIRLPQRSVIITFDDGYKDNYTNAFPILQKYGAFATFFLTTGFLDGSNVPWWDGLAIAIQKTTIPKVNLGILGKYNLNSPKDKLLTISMVNRKLKKMDDTERIQKIEWIKSKLGINTKENDRYNQFMSWDNIMEMDKEGMQFGAHTITHCNLTKESIIVAKREIIESKKRIEEKLKKDIVAFCYPYGDKEFLNQDIIFLVRKSGFFCAVSTDFGINTLNGKLNLYVLKRINIDYQDSFGKFKMKLNEFVINCYLSIRKGDFL